MEKQTITRRLASDDKPDENKLPNGKSNGPNNRRESDKNEDKRDENTLSFGKSNGFKGWRLMSVMKT